jgi:hypothetical protein
LRWPWITREHHAEVVEAYEAHLRSLENQINVLQRKLDAPQTPLAVTVKLPDDFAVERTAIVRRTIGAENHVNTKNSEQAKPIDYTTIDENNPAHIAELAARELGPRATPYAVAAVVRRIKTQIRMAKEQKAIKLREMGVMHQGVAPSTRVVFAEKSEAEHDAPERIRQMIEAAEAGIEATAWQQ